MTVEHRPNNCRQCAWHQVVLPGQSSGLCEECKEKLIAKRYGEIPAFQPDFKAKYLITVLMDKLRTAKESHGENTIPS